MYRIGFLVNPVAGMGGSVGLKGTDGVLAEAVRRGAEPQAMNRAKVTLAILQKDLGLQFLTCSGAMGEEALRQAGIEQYEVIYQYTGESTAQDTRQAAERFLAAGVGLILFCGGDGTARDIFAVVGRNVPLLGIPAGVKMYSAVFAIDPVAAAELLTATDRWSFRDSEVLDIDEERYRAGELSARLFGVARTPAIPGKIQESKQVFEDQDEDRAKDEIARFMHEVMLPDTLYILGAGTTTESIARRIGVKKTLLGVDAVKNGEIVAQDADEKTLIDLVGKEKRVRILISPIGAQGFILGRGNQQISAGVVRHTGVKNIIVVATPHKLRETPVLYVDTGDPALNREFGDSIQVISGYRMAQRRKIFQHVHE